MWLVARRRVCLRAHRAPLRHVSVTCRVWWSLDHVTQDIAQDLASCSSGGVLDGTSCGILDAGFLFALLAGDGVRNLLADDGCYRACDGGNDRFPYLGPDGLLLLFGFLFLLGFLGGSGLLGSLGLGFGLSLEHLKSALAVGGLLVLGADVAGGVHDVEALALGDSADLAQGEQDFSALDDAGSAFLVEERYQCLARLEVEDGVLGLEFGVGAEGLGGHLDGLLVARSVGTQGMLDAVAELPQYDVGDIGGQL